MSKFEANGARRVLLIEEDHLGAETRALILNRSGFEAIVVYGAEMALETVSSLHPDVVIFNVSLPDASAADIAFRIGNKLPGCRVILLSSRTELVDALTTICPEGKSLEVLSKPIHPQTLLDYLCGPALPSSETYRNADIASPRTHAMSHGIDGRPSGRISPLQQNFHYE